MSQQYDPLGRRTFLRVVVASAAATAGPPGCRAHRDEVEPEEEERLAVFPQSVASGDPRPDAVLLWTRVEPEGESGPIDVEYEVARDDGFDDVVARGEVVADPDADHTIRLRLTDLEPKTIYYYRFIARGVPSPVGRTKTAPAPDDDVEVRFAVASCQEYVGRWYHAWRTLAQEPDDLDFVLFLGDYIYETIADPRFQPQTTERALTLPDGLSLDGTDTNLAAVTLADYRALYRQYRSDPDLRHIHERYPFILVWDDHEFTNDGWQDVANEFDGTQGIERNTQRREDATRAWFEYLPVDVPYDGARGFPDDIVTYRSLQYGRHVQLWLTDVRYYRDDHLVPEDETEPLVGKFQPNTPLGSRIFALKQGFDELEAQARPTMLGAAQRAWLTEDIRASGATWKLLASALLVAQMRLDLRSFDELPFLLQNVFYFKVDQWDGFRTERAELLSELADVSNLLVLSGDLHGNYASRLRPDFDAPETPATAVELTVTGISSISLQEQLDTFAVLDPMLAEAGVDAITPLFDQALTESNPHFVYANSEAYGYLVVNVARDEEILATFVEIDDDVLAPSYAGGARRIAFRVTRATPELTSA